MSADALTRLETFAGGVDTLQTGPPPGVGRFEPTEASLALVLGLAVATAAIALAAGSLRDQRAVGTALVTSLFGALVVGTIGWLIEPGLVAAVLGLVAWVAVLRFQYGGDWTDAAVLGAATWAVALVIATLLSLVGLPVVVVGVPGV